MPKRKRPTSSHDLQSEIRSHLTQSRKSLHRALKTAKGFERQKLGKRLKIAQSSKPEDVVRINKEIEVLKALDLGKVGEGALGKGLGKVKVFRESAVLMEELGSGGVEEGNIFGVRVEGEEEIKAVRNVVSGLCNIKGVKEVMGEVIRGMYLVMEIPIPVIGKAKGKGEPLKGILKGGDIKKDESIEHEDIDSQAEGEPAWEGFESENEGLEGQSEDEDGGENTDISEAEEGVSLDEETLSRYDTLLGGSSDEESFDEQTYKSNNTPQTRFSYSPSPSQSPSPPPESKSKPTAKIKTPKQPPPPTKLSTFLPTLMGGYWSGSDSSASDLEDDPSQPVIRKNRPGQMARRAIWEKKFGSGANHIKQGLGPVSQKKDDGWDARRGAKDGSRGRGGSGARGRGRPVQKREFSHTTGENAMPVGEKRQVAKKRDDVGVLHPSWQAAKKAKTEQKQATFTGKKVVFD